jgi:hypothetical protein
MMDASYDKRALKKTKNTTGFVIYLFVTANQLCGAFIVYDIQVVVGVVNGEE